MKRLYAWFLSLWLISPALAGDQISSDCADAIARNGIDPWNQLPVECGGGDGSRNVGGISRPPKPTTIQSYENAQRAHKGFKAMNAAAYFCPTSCRR